VGRRVVSLSDSRARVRTGGQPTYVLPQRFELLLSLEPVGLLSLKQCLTDLGDHDDLALECSALLLPFVGGSGHAARRGLARDPPGGRRERGRKLRDGRIGLIKRKGRRRRGRGRGWGERAAVGEP